MSKKVCPKCGFLQGEAEECGRCGIIFKRYLAASRAPKTVYSGNPQEQPKARQGGWLHRGYCVLRWTTLIGLVVPLVLILYPSQPPQVVAYAGATERAEAKVREFQMAAHSGRSPSMELDEAELNGWLGSNLAIRQPVSAVVSQADVRESAIALAKQALAPEANAGPTVEQVQSAVQDVRIDLRQNSLRAYVLFELFGKELSLELEGQLTVREGCLRLIPTGGKLGSLPLLAGTLESATRRLFDSPENREKFRLPPQIRDVHVEAGRLVISCR